MRSAMQSEVQDPLRRRIAKLSCMKNFQMVPMRWQHYLSSASNATPIEKPSERLDKLWRAIEMSWNASCITLQMLEYDTKACIKRLNDTMRCAYSTIAHEKTPKLKRRTLPIVVYSDTALANRHDWTSHLGRIPLLVDIPHMRFHFHSKVTSHEEWPPRYYQPKLSYLLKNLLTALSYAHYYIMPYHAQFPCTYWQIRIHYLIKSTRALAVLRI